MFLLLVAKLLCILAPLFSSSEQSLRAIAEGWPPRLQSSASLPNKQFQILGYPFFSVNMLNILCCLWNSSQLSPQSQRFLWEYVGQLMLVVLGILTGVFGPRNSWSLCPSCGGPRLFRLWNWELSERWLLNEGLWIEHKEKCNLNIWLYGHTFSKWSQALV